MFYYIPWLQDKIARKFLKSVFAVYSDIRETHLQKNQEWTVSKYM